MDFFLSWILPRQPVLSQSIWSHFQLDALAFTGHKGLRGPQGTGGFLIRNELASQIEPLLSGGTGSVSHTEEVPSFLPDRFEPGTPNIPGILGLHAALCDLEQTDMDKLHQHELELTQYFINGLMQMDPSESTLRAIGKHNTIERTSVVSVQTLQTDMARVAYEMDDTYGIIHVSDFTVPQVHTKHLALTQKERFVFLSDQKTHITKLILLCMPLQRLQVLHIIYKLSFLSATTHPFAVIFHYQGVSHHGIQTIRGFCCRC